MTHFIPCLLLAAAGILDPIEDATLHPRTPDTLFSTQVRDVLLIVGAAVIMALILFLWAYLTRKNRQRHSASTRGARAIYRAEKGALASDGRRRRIRKRRHEHPENLRRNPTLAEAGGLPPLAPEDPKPDPAPPAPAEPPRPPAP